MNKETILADPSIQTILIEYTGLEDIQSDNANEDKRMKKEVEKALS